LTKIGVGDNVVDITRHAKFYLAPFRSFGSPYTRFSVPSGVTILTLFWVLQLATAYTPKRIFTKNTLKDVVPAKDVPFWGPDDHN